MNIVFLLFDIALISLLGVAIYHAVRLSRQLTTFRVTRMEMERFVLDFSATITRAENGIKNLKATARTSGDDLESLIDKAQNLREELHFLVDSADKIASRLTTSASLATRAATPEKDTRASTPQPARATEKPAQNVTQAAEKSLKENLSSLTGTSAAEKELLRALKKIG